LLGFAAKGLRAPRSLRYCGKTSRADGGPFKNQQTQAQESQYFALVIPSIPAIFSNDSNVEKFPRRNRSAAASRQTGFFSRSCGDAS
jgi:hypothetical protein